MTSSTKDLFKRYWKYMTIFAVVAVPCVLMWTQKDRALFREGPTVDMHDTKRTEIEFAAEKGSKGIVMQREALRERVALPGSTRERDMDSVLDRVFGEEMGTDARIRELRKLRGTLLSENERWKALDFLAGRNLPDGLGRGSINWISDEVLTILRLQEPRWEGLSGELAEIAFLPSINPVTRDYITQHLGHIWEENGSSPEIEETLWKGVGTTDETTPGTSLIALGKGYTRDGRDIDMEKVRQVAFELAADPETGVGIRATALAIAGEESDPAVVGLAWGFLAAQDTNVILRKVAEHVLSREQR